MAGAPATTALSHSQQELWNTKDEQEDTANPNEWENYEDPALKWVEFVEACRAQDPSKVRPYMLLARSSNWTLALWKLAAPHDEDDFENAKYEREEISDSDEDAPWCEGCEGPCVCGAEQL